MITNPDSSSSGSSTCDSRHCHSVGCTFTHPDDQTRVRSLPGRHPYPSPARRIMRMHDGNRLGSRMSSLSCGWALLAVFWVACLIRTTTAVSLSGAMEFPTELIYDRSEPPLPRALLAKRDEDGTALHTRTTSSSSNTLPNTTVTSSPLPSPFDNNIGNNFTVPNCPVFIQGFLNSDAFQNCLPFSMLLKTSTSFFRASQSLVTLTHTLDATCNVDFAQCSALMSSLGTQLKDDANCGADLALQNPMVEMANNGFLAYQPLYHAGCMVNNASGSFCYADAVTNASSPTGSYIYYLPLGIAMPGGTQPPCNDCMRNTMDLFATTAVNGSVPALSANYLPAAEQMDILCGPTFAQTNVKTASSAALNLPVPRALLTSTPILSLFIAWFLL